MTFTLKNRPTLNDRRFYDLKELDEWFRGLEKQERQSAIRLLVCRAGGRLNMFEAGMLYQKCLLLGLEDSRVGRHHEQEKHWQSLVLSCMTMKEAEQKLKEILHE